MKYRRVEESKVEKTEVAKNVQMYFNSFIQATLGMDLQFSTCSRY